jgi:hypothetical protein
MPTLTLTALETTVEIGGISPPFYDNADAGIIDYGAGIEATFDAEAGILASTEFDAEVGIEEITFAPPTSVLAVHIAHGQVMVVWDEPAEPTLVRRYEVFAKISTRTNYSMINHRVRGNQCILRLPMGASYNIRVRAVYRTGDKSVFATSKLGEITMPEDVVMNVTAISGSTIPAGAVFSVSNRNLGVSMAFQAVNAIDIS